MGTVKNALKFSLAMVPVSVLAGLCLCIYQLDLYTEEQLAPILEQAGSLSRLVLIGTGETLVSVLLASFFGCLLAHAVGLWKPMAVESALLVRCMVASAVAGALYSLDFWVFGYFLEEVRESIVPGLTIGGVAAAMLYGAVVEEILMRLFVMSLTAFVLWKLFFHRRSRADLPEGVFVAANITAALVFAIGHLPAEQVMFGALTPLVVFRCILINGGFGLLFGRIYRKCGLRCAMLSHATLHLVSKLIWGLLL